MICLTPVWNEAWILDRFLACASLWADQILIADQDSNDGSREIALSHPKVTLIQNTTPRYDEGARQKVLIDAARTIPGRRVLVALDADEALSANVCRSDAWRDAISGTPGTVIRLPWVNHAARERPGMGSRRRSSRSHTSMTTSPMLDCRSTARACRGLGISPTFDLTEVVVLHYQYLDGQRMRAKQRWYQCHERLELPGKRPAENLPFASTTTWHSTAGRR